MSVVPVITPAEARAWDAAASRAGLPVSTLMSAAGRAVAQLVLERFPRAAARGVLVACGPGNNGGDGWVAARALHALGVPVAVVAAGPSHGDAVAARVAALHDGVPLQPIEATHEPGVVVDALLGGGASGPPRGEIAAILRRIDRSGAPIVAIDGPSDLDLGNGVQHGTTRARLSVTFGAMRRGLLLNRAAAGDIVVVDIGLPPGDRAWPVLVDAAWGATHLPPIAFNAHKGMRGRVVIVGGAPSMVGAVRLATRAAFATGAGLVHAVVPEESAAVLRTAEPDVQVVAHPLGGKLSPHVVELVSNADAVAVGPGLGRAPERAPFVLELLRLSRGAVVDADALTVLAEHREALAALARERTIVCTPHPGEFRTLFADCVVDDLRDPWGSSATAALRSGATVLLKGVPTVVADRSGAMRTVAAGNPGLATGGSGDLLTGMIAALLAQRCAPLDAAAMAALAHGEAADIAARRVTARAMRPMDVIVALPDVWRAWARPGGLARAPILADLPLPQST